MSDDLDVDKVNEAMDACGVAIQEAMDELTYEERHMLTAGLIKSLAQSMAAAAIRGKRGRK